MENKYSVKSIHNRIPVTAQWLWEEGTDIPAYIFNKDAWHSNPWIEITGVDEARDGSEIILQYGTTGEKRVPPNYRVFISRNTEKGSRWVQCGGCCGEGEFVGLSRKDNETFLCPTCEHREAIDEYYKTSNKGD
jgi:hypothetical protein